MNQTELGDNLIGEEGRDILKGDEFLLGRLLMEYLSPGVYWWLVKKGEAQEALLEVQSFFQGA